MPGRPGRVAVVIRRRGRPLVGVRGIPMRLGGSFVCVDGAGLSRQSGACGAGRTVGCIIQATHSDNPLPELGLAMRRSLASLARGLGAAAGFVTRVGGGMALDATIFVHD